MAGCISWRMDYIAKQADSTNNGTRGMEFSLLDGEQGGKHNSADFVETTKLSTAQDTLSLTWSHLTK